MSKKAITEVEGRIKKILADRLTETADIEERMKTAKQQQETASEAMDSATSAGDVAAYQKAKASLRDAEDAIEMYNRRLDALRHKPLISKGECENGVARIMNALEEVSADAKKRIIEHMEQIRIIAAECTEEIAKGNEVLHQWQHEIYKGDMGRLEKRFDDYSVPQFGSHMLESGYYENFVGRKIEGVYTWKPDTINI